MHSHIRLKHILNVNNWRFQLLTLFEGGEVKEETDIYLITESIVHSWWCVQVLRDTEMPAGWQMHPRSLRRGAGGVERAFRFSQTAAAASSGQAAPREYVHRAAAGEAHPSRWTTSQGEQYFRLSLSLLLLLLLLPVLCSGVPQIVEMKVPLSLRTSELSNIPRFSRQKVKVTLQLCMFCFRIRFIQLLFFFFLRSFHPWSDVSFTVNQTFACDLTNFLLLEGDGYHQQVIICQVTDCFFLFFFCFMLLPHLLLSLLLLLLL